MLRTPKSKGRDGDGHGREARGSSNNPFFFPGVGSGDGHGRGEARRATYSKHGENVTLRYAREGWWDRYELGGVNERASRTEIQG